MEITCFTWVTSFLLFFVTFLYSVSRHGYLRLSYYTGKLPGKKGWPIIGNLFDVMVPVEEFLNALIRLCPHSERLTGVTVFHRHFAMLYKPETVAVVLNNPKYTHKGECYRLFKTWLREGLVTSEGAKWTAKRRLLTPSFHFKMLEDFVDVMNERSMQLADRLAGELSGEFIDIAPKMSLCTLDIICETAMGKSINASENDASGAAYTKAIMEITPLIMFRATRPWFMNDWLFSLSNEGKMHDAHLNTLHNFTYKVFQERKATFKSRKNEIDEDEAGRKKRRPFLDLLLEVADDGNVLSDAEIIEEVDTFMAAGYETTSTATAWCLYALACNPEYQKKVHEELDGIFGDSARPVTLADLPYMKFTDMCIKETMRLYPPVPVISRELLHDVVIADHLIPAGTLATIMISHLHRDPEVFPNPDAFNPDNFSPERTKDRHPYAFIPFSAGPRNCIGQKFAGIEGKILLANILRRVRVEALNKPEDLHLIPALVLRAFEGVILKFTPRKCHEK